MGDMQLRIYVLLISSPKTSAVERFQRFRCGGSSEGQTSTECATADRNTDARSVFGEVLFIYQAVFAS